MTEIERIREALQKDSIFSRQAKRVMQAASTVATPQEEGARVEPDTDKCSEA